jgi:hypothetical protein
MRKGKKASHKCAATMGAATGQSRSQAKTEKLRLSVVEKSRAGHPVADITRARPKEIRRYPVSLIPDTQLNRLLQIAL